MIADAPKKESSSYGMKRDPIKEAACRLVDCLLETVQEVNWDVSNLGANPLEKQLTELLKAAGVAASYEYPGYITVRTKRGSLDVGTANGEWGMDIIDEQGQNIEDQAGAPYDSWLSNISKREPQEVSPAELIEHILEVVNWANRR